MPRLILIKATRCYFGNDTQTVSRPTHLNQKQTLEIESVRLGFYSAACCEKAGDALATREFKVNELKRKF
jgi:hypothetical protein